MIRLLAVLALGGCVEELPVLELPQIHRCEIDTAGEIEIVRTCATDTQALADELRAPCAERGCVVWCEPVPVLCEPGR